LLSLSNSQARDPLVEAAIKEFIETKGVAIFHADSDISFKDANNKLISARILSHIDMTQDNEAKILGILMDIHETPSILELCSRYEAESNSIQKVKQLLAKKVKDELK
jgi:hypothetical protein